MKGKIKLSEFWKSEEKLAIHCDTEEKAIKLLRAFDKMGKRWICGNSYLESNYWKVNKEDTCYNNINRYSSINWYKKYKYKIYEFEDIDFEEEKKMKRKIKLRDMTKEDFAKWKEKKCVKISCKDCVFCKAPCTEPNDEDSWINNKDLYSDKFLDQEVEIDISDILDEKEKEYLRNVIKPFRNRVISIEKASHDDSCFISITIKRMFNETGTESINLPFFKEDTMYKGMMEDYAYTLKDLDL
jgi:hypothetical protein